MNDDSPVRGRPKKQFGKGDIQLHVWVDADLWNAAHDEKCSQSYTVTRALRALTQHGKPDTVPALILQCREARKEIGHGNAVLSEARKKLKKLGVDPDDESVRGEP